MDDFKEFDHVRQPNYAYAVGDVLFGARHRGAAMIGEPTRLLSRLFEACMGVLLASMALYGAVVILEAIWIWLCIIVAVVAIAAAIIVIALRFLQRW